VRGRVRGRGEEGGGYRSDEGRAGGWKEEAGEGRGWAR
jgi:hypothetical protein